MLEVGLWARQTAQIGASAALSARVSAIMKLRSEGRAAIT
jgi:hypothetical protein